ncbi:MAG: type II toxin-antitoxin system HicA family toxin [SAR202 cluster bacterium]|nr:type II toxin-antitoxin system HicA family toxin [SAR202 cluster bacterium]
MARLPVLSGDEFARVMQRAGFLWDHTQGSRMILIGPEGRRLSIPRHRELGRGIMRPLIRDAGLTRDDFLRLVRR